ncbi:MAG TPA: hemerythrin domain-containing protein, partial [Candidatus Dormibacteraeota bacterium]|nr:hemerythrin domain-containing protein [Candidatus Dormibacteraeota bacterium]
MTAFEDGPETARGRWAYQALIAIHRLIRRDLAAVERLAAAVLDGLPTSALLDELAALKSDSTLWQLQLSCLRHCGFVHLHHHMEDIDFFAELEETNPAIRPVVQRLRAEHVAISDLLDAVEA